MLLSNRCQHRTEWDMERTRLQLSPVEYIHCLTNGGWRERCDWRTCFCWTRVHDGDCSVFICSCGTAIVLTTSHLTTVGTDVQDVELTVPDARPPVDVDKESCRPSSRYCTCILRVMHYPSLCHIRSFTLLVSSLDPVCPCFDALVK
jgi:hypothetical protein